MVRRKFLWLGFLLVAVFLLSRWPAGFSQAKDINYEQAEKYVNQLVTVEGKIVSTHNSGRACFLNFHPDYRRYLSLVIFASDFSKFPPSPEKFYLNKKVRVSGRVKLYQGRPEIILSSPSQIKILPDDAPEKAVSRPGPDDVNQTPEMKNSDATGRAVSSPKPGGNIPEISWDQAGDYLGHKVWVRGRVVATNNTGKVCFLNFHRNWRRYFTVVIFASAFDRFPQPPEKLYAGKEIRVFGEIKEYQGKPEIVVETPEQIEIID